MSKTSSERFWAAGEEVMQINDTRLTTLGTGWPPVVEFNLNNSCSSPLYNHAAPRYTP